MWWSIRPLTPRCGSVCDGRTVEAIAARLLVMLGVTNRLGRPSLIGGLDDGCPMEENRGPAPAKFGALPEKRAPPKPTPPPRMPTPPAKPPADPPPWKPPPWKPPPPKPPPPPPPCPAAQVMGASVTKVM